MHLNNTLTNVERSFNIAGSIPVVALVSGSLRATAAKAQFLAGLAFGLVGLIGQIASANTKKYENITDKASEQIIHGFLNFVRGTAELLLGITFIGTLGILAYQSLSERKFEPIIPYSD